MEGFTMPRGLVDEVCAALGIELPGGRADVGELYTAWCAAVPFDPVAKSAALAERRPPPGDDPVEVAERWLSTGLGSTCWGHVTVLGAILEAAGLRVAAGVDRMLRDDIVDFHSFLIAYIDGDPHLLDPIHPSGEPLPLVGGARGNHPAYAVGLDEVDGRLIHWFEQPLDGSRAGRYIVLSTVMDRADVRAFCVVSADFSGVGRRFFQRRILGDAFVVSRPIEDGTALATTTWRSGGEDVVTISDVDEALAAVGYRRHAVGMANAGRAAERGPVGALDSVISSLGARAESARTDRARYRRPETRRDRVRPARDARSPSSP